MVSQVLANAILSSKAPDIVGEFQRGQEVGRQGKARELAGAAMKAGGGEDLDELYNVDPELAYTIGEKINAKSAQDINNYIRDAKVGLGYLNSNDIQGFLSFGRQRLNSLRLQGRDIANTQNIVNMVANGDVDKARQLMAATVGAIDKSKETASITDFKFKTEGLSDQETLDAKRVDLGLKARAGESAQERIAKSGDLTSQVAGSQAQIKGASSGASEAAKLSVQGRLLPEIKRSIKMAEAEAVSAGETSNDLTKAKASYQGVQSFVSQLRDLAPLATETMVGRGFDIAAKELGFGSTKGATARAKYIAIIDNELLPLLKPTFGAAFTEKEGEKLKATLGDPNAGEDVKNAALDAFLESFDRKIQRMENELGGGGQQSAAPSVINWSEL